VLEPGVVQEARGGSRTAKACPRRRAIAARWTCSIPTSGTSARIVRRASAPSGAGPGRRATTALAAALVSRVPPDALPDAHAGHHH
jgi:hypothetical protein